MKRPKKEYPINEAVFGPGFKDLPDGVDEMRAKYAWRTVEEPTLALDARHVIEAFKLGLIDLPLPKKRQRKHRKRLTS